MNIFALFLIYLPLVSIILLIIIIVNLLKKSFGEARAYFFIFVILTPYWIVTRDRFFSLRRKDIPYLRTNEAFGDLWGQI